MVLPEFYLDFWRAYDVLRPLGLFVASIVIYGVFVFHFYRFLARKDIFRLDLSKYNESGHPVLRKTISVIFYLLRSAVMFPLFVSFWFIVLTGLLLLMGRSQSVDSIMLGAMGVVATIRVCAYYNEALATDIAKILPFALLGIMLIDNSLVRIPDPAESIQDAAMRIETVTYYLMAVVALEFLLRLLSGIIGLVRRSPNRADTGVRDANPKPEPDQSRAQPPAPTVPPGPLHGTPQSEGSAFDQVYGRPLYNLPASDRPRQSEPGYPPETFPELDGTAAYPGRTPIRSSALWDAPEVTPPKITP